LGAKVVKYFQLAEQFHSFLIKAHLTFHHPALPTRQQGSFFFPKKRHK
jgi:hypothetical protein